MVHAIRQIVRVEPGGVVSLRSADLSPGSQVEVIVLPVTPDAPPPPLSSLRGAAKGLYSNPAQADAFLRTERDSWDR